MRSGFSYKTAIKKITAFLLTAVFCLSAFSGIKAYAAPAWPEFSSELTAGSAVVMDADSREVLYGKNLHEKLFPASITKIMTALIVIENCSPDEEVIFTESAVRNLEAGAVTIGAKAGDVLSVRDCLYALMLKSANEVANALAEHVAGSVADFTDMMDERARQLGCLNTDFENPNGLTNDAHLTTAYDMALIASACFENETFLEIESEESRKIGPTQAYPEGQTVSIGHRMKKKGNEYYDERVKAGKTGFTSASGNTLVTLAEDGGRRVVAVVLKDKMPDHYRDTKRLIDYGLNSFGNITVEDTVGEFGIKERLLADGIIPEGDNDTGADAKIFTVPAGAGLKDIVPKYEYNIEGGVSGYPDVPENAVAFVAFKYGSRKLGTSYITNVHESSISMEDGPDAGESGGAERKAGIPYKLIAAAAVLLIFGAGISFIVISSRRSELERRKAARERRLRRLEEMGMSEEQFSEYIRSYRKKNDREEKK